MDRTIIWFWILLSIINGLKIFGCATNFVCSRVGFLHCLTNRIHICRVPPGITETEFLLATLWYVYQFQFCSTAFSRCQQFLKTKSLLTSTSNVLPYYPKQTLNFHWMWRRWDRIFLNLFYFKFPAINRPMQWVDNCTQAHHFQPIRGWGTQN